MSSNDIKLFGIKKVIKYYKYKCEEIPLKYSKYMSIGNGIDIYNAIKCGHLILVMKYYVDGGSKPFIDSQLRTAAEYGFIKIFQFIINYAKWNLIDCKTWSSDKTNIHRIIESAAKGGHINIIILLANKYLKYKYIGNHYNVAIQAAIKFKQEMIPLYFYNIGSYINESHINMACLKGCINLLLYFFTNGKLDKKYIELLVERGQLDCIKCLHSQNCKYVNDQLLDYAVFKNQMPIIEYLRNSGFRFSHDALNYAVCNNDMDMLRYLYDHIPYCTPNALCNAINEDNMEIIEYLCDHYQEHCMTCCMVVACSDKKTEIVDWFCKNFSNRHFKEIKSNLHNKDFYDRMVISHMNSHCYVLNNVSLYKYYDVCSYFNPPKPYFLK